MSIQGTNHGAKAPAVVNWPIAGAVAAAATIVGGVVAGVVMHRVDLTARAAKETSLAQTVLVVNRYAGIGAAATSVGLIVQLMSRPTPGTDGRVPAAKSYTAYTAAVLGAAGLAVGGGAVHNGYSTLFTPAGAFNPRDVAGNLSARYARAGDKPGIIVKRVIQFLGHR
jgi:hypothetical protein